MITKNVGAAMGLWLVLLMGLVPISAQAVSATAALEGESVKTPFGTYTSVPPEGLRLVLKSVDDITLINVHVPYEGEIAGTEAFTPFDQLERRRGPLPQNKTEPVAVYCMSGRMSEIASRTLLKLGYTQVIELRGGMIAWRQSGLPLIDGE